MSGLPDVVVHALTRIPPRGPLRPRDLAATNELRRTATRNLVRAALAAGARRLVIESMVFVYGFGDRGTEWITEQQPIARSAPHRWLQPALNALHEAESQVGSRAGGTNRRRHPAIWWFLRAWIRDQVMARRGGLALIASRSASTEVHRIPSRVVSDSPR
jgi:hypothetical protein